MNCLYVEKYGECSTACRSARMSCGPLVMSPAQRVVWYGIIVGLLAGVLAL